MSPSNNIHALVGATSRYIAGRNAMQTVYWRSAGEGSNTRMIKYNKTLELDKTQKLPASVRFQYYNRSFKTNPEEQ